MSTASTQRGPTMATQTFSSRESTSTTMRRQVRLETMPWCLASVKATVRGFLLQNPVNQYKL